jgi:hypothetical protein
LGRRGGQTLPDERSACGFRHWEKVCDRPCHCARARQQDCSPGVVQAKLQDPLPLQLTEGARDEDLRAGAAPSIDLGPQIARERIHVRQHQGGVLSRHEDVPALLEGPERTGADLVCQGVDGRAALLGLGLDLDGFAVPGPGTLQLEHHDSRSGDVN